MKREPVFEDEFLRIISCLSKHDYIEMSLERRTNPMTLEIVVDNNDIDPIKTINLNKNQVKQILEFLGQIYTQWDFLESGDRDKYKMSDEKPE